MTKTQTEQLLDSSYLLGWRFFCLGDSNKVIIWDPTDEYLVVVEKQKLLDAQSSNIRPRAFLKELDKRNGFK